MEFLYRLYSNDYFGIGLFIVITVLAFSFLVILFFGKKDEKARSAEKLANVNNEEIKTNEIENTTDEFATKTLETITIPENEAKEEGVLVENIVEPEEKDENEEDNSFIQDIFTLNRTPEMDEKDATSFTYDTEEPVIEESVS